MLSWREHTAGIDLELYGIGREIRRVRKQSPLTSGGACDAAAVSAAARPVPVAQELRALGRRCGELLGFEPFGVDDCVETPAGPVVIEVNDFPNYTGAPQADDWLAAHIAARRFGRVSG